MGRMATKDERENARLAIREAQRIETEDLAWLMQEKAGRRFVWRLLSEAGVFQSSYSESATETAYREGRRASGLKLLNDTMRVAKEQFVVMLLEHEHAG